MKKIINVGKPRSNKVFPHKLQSFHLHVTIPSICPSKHTEKSTLLITKANIPLPEALEENN